MPAAVDPVAPPVLYLSPTTDSSLAKGGEAPF